MPNNHCPMRLSPEEENFLRHWMYDEMHYREGTGRAKRLQREHQVPPAELAVIIGAAMPDLTEQWAAGLGPPPSEPPIWPWSGDSFHSRLADATEVLAERSPSNVKESILSAPPR
jgi:hypothetical protein